MSSVRQILHKYIFAPAKDPEKSRIMMPGYSGIQRLVSSGNPQDTLDPALLRQLALLEPLVLKGIRKKNKDIFRKWFDLELSAGNGAVSQQVKNIIKEFDTRTNIKYKFLIASICSNIYGDGFIERTFIENKPNHVEPSPNAKPLGLIVLDPECIHRSLEKMKDGGDTLYYVYEDKKAGTPPVYIHPKRIIHIKEDWLPNSHFGISKIYTLQKILQSKMNSDESLGQIMCWFSHGIQTMKINNANDEQIKKMLEMFAQHPDYYVYDQDYEFKIDNPSQISPEEFYRAFYIGIGAGVEIPTHILTGESADIGSDTNISDYFNDISNLQEIVFTPLLTTVYKQLLESNGIKWKYDLVWNPVFVDELSEAKISQTRAYSASQLYNAGIVDLEESRQIMNEGFTFLDPKKDISPKESTVSVPVDQPNIAPQPVIKPKTTKFVPFLNDEQRSMIANAERILGETELREQEKRFEEAKKRLAKK